MIFRVSVLLALATFSLSAWAKYLGKWVSLPCTRPAVLNRIPERSNQGLENVAITCPNDDLCRYNFRITRGIGTPDQFYRHTDCNFTTTRFLDHPASHVNVTNRPCSGSFDQFNISSQWYYRGFITFRVVHEVSDGWAFFGYEASQVLNANASRLSVSDCYQIGTFNATDRPPGYPVGKTPGSWLVAEAQGDMAGRNV